MFSLLTVDVNSQESSEWWYMSQKDLANTGYYDSVGPMTNNVLWNSTLGSWVWSDVAVVDGLVFVGCYDNKTYALDQTNGNIVWEYETQDTVYSSPVVADGVVYIGSDDGNVYALDAKTGNLNWKFTTGDEVQAPAKVVNGIVYIGSADNNFYALDATNGDVIWMYTTGDDVIAPPAIANGVVYIGSFDYNVYALDATNGDKIWSFPTESFVESTPTFSDGVVYFGSFDNKTYAVDATTGQEIWSVETGHDLCVQSSPAVANGVVIIGSSYAGTLHGSVFAYDVLDGSLKWEYKTDGLVFASPIVVGDVVYVGSSYMGPVPDLNDPGSYTQEELAEFFSVVLKGRRGHVYALDASSGEEIWNYQTGGAVYSSPAVVDGVMYIGSMDSNVYAFGVSTQSDLDIPLTYIIVGIVAILIVVVVLVMLKKQKK